MVETGEAREVHHHCLLIGYGADAINPYLAFEALWQARRDGLMAATLDDEKIVAAYRKGVAKGMLKVMAKMGISTLQSYKGAQIFEALGLKDEVIDKCFVGTASRIQGVILRRDRRRSVATSRTGVSRTLFRQTAGASQPGRIPLAEPKVKNMPGRRESIRRICKSPLETTTKMPIGNSPTRSTPTTGLVARCEVYCDFKDTGKVDSARRS